MPYPEKADRNAAWVHLREKRKWSFADIAESFGCTRQRVHQVFHREKRKGRSGSGNGAETETSAGEGRG